MGALRAAKATQGSQKQASARHLSCQLTATAIFATGVLIMVGLFSVALNKREAKEIIEMFFEEIRTALGNGEVVKLSGFGNFDLRDKHTRPGRNPKTGEEIPITARRVVTFKPGMKLKARVEECTQSKN